MKIITLIFVFLLFVSSALACSCPVHDPAQQLSAATVVFSGKVSQITTPVIRVSSADEVHIVLDTLEVWKGEPKAQYSLTTAVESASCGYTFAKGESYLIYATGEPNDLQAGLCTVQLLAESRDIALLGSGTKEIVDPEPESFFAVTDIMTSLLWIGVFVIIVVIGFFMHKRAKR